MPRVRLSVVRALPSCRLCPGCSAEEALCLLQPAGGAGEASGFRLRKNSTNFVLFRVPARPFFVFRRWEASYGRVRTVVRTRPYARGDASVRTYRQVLTETLIHRWLQRRLLSPFRRGVRTVPSVRKNTHKSGLAYTCGCGNWVLKTQSQLSVLIF